MEKNTERAELSALCLRVKSGGDDRFSHREIQTSESSPAHVRWVYCAHGVMNEKAERRFDDAAWLRPIGARGVGGPGPLRKCFFS